MAEKIKISFLIDKEAVYDCAFRNSESEEEYNQVKDILKDKDEIVRDIKHTYDDKNFVAEITRAAANTGLDEILCTNKDLLMSKRKQKEVDDAEHEDDTPDFGKMQCVKITGEQAKEIIKKLLGDEDKEDKED